MKRKIVGAIAAGLISTGIAQAQGPDLTKSTFVELQKKISYWHISRFLNYNFENSALSIPQYEELLYGGLREKITDTQRSVNEVSKELNFATRELGWTLVHGPVAYATDLCTPGFRENKPSDDASDEKKDMYDLELTRCNPTDRGAVMTFEAGPVSQVVRLDDLEIDLDRDQASEHVVLHASFGEFNPDAKQNFPAGQNVNSYFIISVARYAFETDSRTSGREDGFINLKIATCGIQPLQTLRVYDVPGTKDRVRGSATDHWVGLKRYVVPSGSQLTYRFNPSRAERDFTMDLTAKVQRIDIPLNIYAATPEAADPRAHCQITQ